MLKTIGLAFYILCMIALVLAMGWVMVVGFKSDQHEKRVCAQLHGELIDRTGPTRCVKEVIPFTEEERANVR